ncbi:MAG: shikimate dehydrogenase, partial [Spirochaeta sp.]|nr:shikimate dehydrogenase [Spirochaeta sp.]
MGEHNYRKADKPTMYFIGVTTGKSSIMKVFPEWARYLKLPEVVIKGIDFRLHDEPKAYREVVAFIREDPLSLGALVTSHKIDLFEACRDMFDELGSYARIMEEVSCISKRNGKLQAQAKDPISSGLALEHFLPDNYWKETGAEIFLMGAGGAAIALTSYLAAVERGSNKPSRIYVANRSSKGLERMKNIHDRLQVDIPVEYILTPVPEENDRVVNKLKPYSLVINATGLGKDTPGSPITDDAVFPENGIAWDFNYRGDLVFIKQAYDRQKERNLNVEDGWVYFIHGWTRVISEVCNIL